MKSYGGGRSNSPAINTVTLVSSLCPQRNTAIALYVGHNNCFCLSPCVFSLSVILLILRSNLAYLANSSIMLMEDCSFFISWISALISLSCSASFCTIFESLKEKGGGWGKNDLLLRKAGRCKVLCMDAEAQSHSSQVFMLDNKWWHECHRDFHFCRLSLAFSTKL